MYNLVQRGFFELICTIESCSFQINPKSKHTRFSGISRYMLAMRFQQHIFKHYHSGNDILIFNNWRDRLFGSKKWSKVILVDLNPAYS